MKRENDMLMAVGAHPDDVELFCGGTVAAHVKGGGRAVILDLTRGEMATRGTPAQRVRESLAAAAILGVTARPNLDLGDTLLADTPEIRRQVAAVIREYRPRVILAPHRGDRHPDHAAAGNLVRGAFFDARLAKLDLGHPPHAPELLLFFPCHDYLEPTLVIDVTSVFETRMEAVRRYRSQFSRGPRRTGPPPIGIADYLWDVESRCRHFGSLAGFRYGEGFVAPQPLAAATLGNILDLGTARD